MTDLYTSPRRFTRGTGPDAMSWDQGVQAIQQALDVAGEAEFTEAGPDGSVVAVQLILGPRALTVWGPRGVVGVFASLPAAVRHAFVTLDRAAQQQRAAHTHSTRARRRVTAKEPAR